ncbi:MAG: helix-turn-helix domain-containing protein [Acutalibacteraceae bacterium]
MQSGMILRALRKAKNLTQSDVASLLKTSRQYYSDYECEKFELPLHHLVFWRIIIMYQLITYWVKPISKHHIRQNNNSKVTKSRFYMEPAFCTSF